MKITTKQRKFIFFYLIFHLVGYLSFRLGITPSYTFNNSTYSSEGYYKDEGTYYLLTPNYEDLSKCANCKHGESDNFWPFHSYTFGFGTSWTHPENHGFVGIYGYYGHSEFLVYVILPFIIILLVYMYRGFISPNSKS